MISSDAYRMIVPMLSFWVGQIDNKCKHLSNFPAGTLQTF
jgi:hypothetical protein